MTVDKRDVTPAIVRSHTDKDREVEVMSTPSDRVSFTRGFGESGYRVEVVKHDCPEKHCNFDRMIRRVDVSPERKTEYRYWCLNPNCVHYVSGMFSYSCSGSYPSRTKDEPTVFEGYEA